MEKFESLNSANNGSDDPLSRCLRFLVGRELDPGAPIVDEMGPEDPGVAAVRLASVDNSSGSTSICADHRHEFLPVSTEDVAHPAERRR